MGFISSLTHFVVLGFGGLAGSNSVEFLSQLAASTLVASLWQSAVIAAGIALALKLAPRSTAGVRFKLWATVFATAIALPFVPAVMQQFQTHFADDNVSGYASASAAWGPVWVIDIRWSIAIAALWLAASLYRAADLTRHALRARQLWKSGTPIETSVAASDLSIRSAARSVEICTTTELDRPSVLGFFSPRILIPEWLYARLTQSELAQVILHETEHLARRDDWTNLLQKLGLVLFPLNPVLIWVDCQLSLEREMACDEGVVRRTHAPREYATCLTNLAERGLQHRQEALSLGAWHRRPELARRVHSLLLKKRQLSPAAAATLLLSLGGSVIAGSFELSRCPQLVAFAPRLQERTASVHRNVPLHEQQSSSIRPKAVEASFVQRASSANTRMLDLKAVLQTPDADSNRGRVSLQTKRPAERLLRAEEVTQSLNGGPKFGQQEDLDAQADHANTTREMLSRAVVAESQPIEQRQYIVLTTWEQTVTRPAQEEIVSDSSEIQASSKEGLAAARQISANQAPVNESGASESTLVSKQSLKQSPVYQTTITRLILRVIPANVTTPTPADGMALRSDWFVFKL